MGRRAVGAPGAWHRAQCRTSAEIAESRCRTGSEFVDATAYLLRGTKDLTTDAPAALRCFEDLHPKFLGLIGWIRMMRRIVPSIVTPEPVLFTPQTFDVKNKFLASNALLPARSRC